MIPETELTDLSRSYQIPVELVVPTHRGHNYTLTTSKNGSAAGAITGLAVGIMATVFIYKHCLDNDKPCADNSLAIGSLFIVSPSLLIFALIGLLCTANNASLCYKKIKSCITKANEQEILPDDS